MLRSKSKVRLLFLLGLCLPMLFPGCGTSNAASGGKNNQPEWVRDPYTKYDRQTNVAAVGTGSSREAAEKSAFGNLVSIFGQSISVDEKVSVSYQEAVKNGVAASWSENTALDSVISSSASLGSLVGAEIGDVWDDGRNFYAAAFLNKPRAIQVYSGIVSSNQKMIEKLVNIPSAERNTLDGFARYQFAATVAEMTAPYVNLLSVIGGPAQGIKFADDYRLEAYNITKAIPVNLRVRNDASGRVGGAFAKALSGLGFQSGRSNSRYLLDVNVITSPAVIANSQFKWTRIELSANLVDTVNGTVLLPYNLNSREGHISQAEADNRAIIAAERQINEEYAGLLSDYLSRLLPKK